MKKLLLLAALSASLAAALVYGGERNGMACIPTGTDSTCTAGTAEGDIVNSCNGRLPCSGPSIYCDGNGGDAVDFACAAGSLDNDCIGTTKDCGTQDKFTCAREDGRCEPDNKTKDKTGTACTVRDCTVRGPAY